MKLEWHIEDYDHNDNPIYAAPSVLNDEGTPFYYKFHGVFAEGSVGYESVSDVELGVGILASFDSEMDAVMAFQEIEDQVRA